MSSTLRELLCMQLLPVMFRDRWMRRSGLLTCAAALDWNGLAVGEDWERTSTGLALHVRRMATQARFSGSPDVGACGGRHTGIPPRIPPSCVDRAL